MAASDGIQGFLEVGPPLEFIRLARAATEGEPGLKIDHVRGLAMPTTVADVAEGFTRDGLYFGGGGGEEHGGLTSMAISGQNRHSASP